MGASYGPGGEQIEVDTRAEGLSRAGVEKFLLVWLWQ